MQAVCPQLDQLTRRCRPTVAGQDIELPAVKLTSRDSALDLSLPAVCSSHAERRPRRTEQHADDCEWMFPIASAAHAGSRAARCDDHLRQPSRIARASAIAALAR